MSGLVLMYNLWAVATRPERTKDSRETWNWPLWEMTYSFLPCITEKRGRWMGRQQEDTLYVAATARTGHVPCSQVEAVFFKVMA